jgi:DNA-binding response OmpR family regulator
MGAVAKTLMRRIMPSSTGPGPDTDFCLADLPARMHAVEWKDITQLSKSLPCFVLVLASAERLTVRKITTLKSQSDTADPTGVLPRLGQNATKSQTLNAQAEFSEFSFGEVTVNFLEMVALRKGQPVTLTAMEFKTLRYLLGNPRRVVSRDELLNEVWGYDNYPCTRTVDNHILRLRKKLEKNPARPTHFRTVQRAGYKFLP